MVCKLVTDDTVSNDPKEISNTFATYFSNLYIPKDQAHFDNKFKLEIENKVKSFNANEGNKCYVLTCPVELSELTVCLKDLKKCKSPGVENITNEHLIHEGLPLLLSLQKLYCKMIEQEILNS